MAETIKTDKSRGKMWECIRKLRGEEGATKRKKLYDGNGEEIREENEKQEMMAYWKEIYKGEGNRIRDAWNEERRATYHRDWLSGIEDDKERDRRVIERGGTTTSSNRKAE